MEITERQAQGKTVGGSIKRAGSEQGDIRESSNAAATRKGGSGRGSGVGVLSFSGLGEPEIRGSYGRILGETTADSGAGWGPRW